MAVYVIHEERYGNFGGVTEFRTRAGALAWIGERLVRDRDTGWHVVRVIEGAELKLKPVEVVRGWAFE